MSVQALGYDFLFCLFILNHFHAYQASLVWLVAADVDQILLEAQHRWLRPAEICEILQNYKKFHISAEPPNAPPSMFFPA